MRVRRNHCPGNDPGLLPVHAAQPRVGLPRAGSGDKTDKNASFRYKAYLEEIDYTVSRGLDRNRMERPATLDFIRNGQNLFITGSA